MSRCSSEKSIEIGQELIELRWRTHFHVFRTTTKVWCFC